MQLAFEKFSTDRIYDDTLDERIASYLYVLLKGSPAVVIWGTAKVKVYPSGCVKRHSDSRAEGPALT